MKPKRLICFALIAWAAVPALVAGDSPHRSRYAGMEVREIKSLSPDDQRELLEGGGWGLSLVAELNGVPGPRHLLELVKELDLSAEQVEAIQRTYDDMKGEAMRLGRELIRLEQELDQAFAERAIDDGLLRSLLDSIATTRRDLRFVHLAAHLQTPPLLSGEQIAAYSRLRGYDDGDPCASVPPGHDPAMWRRHNGCEAEPPRTRPPDEP